MQISIDNPIQVILEIDMKDSMSVFPLDDHGGELRDALECGLRSNSTGYEGAGHFRLSMQYENVELVDCSGVVVDEWADDCIGIRPSIVADAYDDTAQLTFKALEEWEGYIPESDDCVDSPCSIYIDRLFVYPEYRRNGIAPFVLDNLPELFNRKYGYNIRYACVLVKPDDQTLMSKDEMRSIMISVIENAGFVRISFLGEDVFVKRYID